MSLGVLGGAEQNHRGSTGEQTLESGGEELRHLSQQAELGRRGGLSWSFCSPTTLSCCLPDTREETGPGICWRCRRDNGKGAKSPGQPPAKGRRQPRQRPGSRGSGTVSLQPAGAAPGEADLPPPPLRGRRTTQDLPGPSWERGSCLLINVLPGSTFHSGSCFPCLAIFVKHFDWKGFPASLPGRVTSRTCMWSSPQSWEHRLGPCQ